MKSHGVEFTLSTRNIRTNDFSWNTDFIFSYAKNEVTQLKGLTSMMELVSGNGFAAKDTPCADSSPSLLRDLMKTVFRNTSLTEK